MKKKFIDINGVLGEIDNLFNKVYRQEKKDVGALDIADGVRHYIKEGLKSCRKSREQVAEEMTTLLGKDVSKAMLDKYVTDDGYMFPLQYVPAFCQVVANYGLLEYVASSVCLEVISAEESIYQQLGVITQRKTELAKAEKSLKLKLQKVGG